MAVSAPSIMANQLIERLPRAERVRLLAVCESVELEFGDVLSEPRQAYSHVYFPVAGFISLLARVKGHPPMEMGMIGNEGLLGASLALGIRAAPQEAVVQGSGSALRAPTAAFQAVLDDSPALFREVSRCLYSLMLQLAQTAVCTRFHMVEARLARWLLMTHDRVQADRLKLTHQYLADMLGVRRSAVSIASIVLKERDLIDYCRGSIDILDRHGLEQVVCECYAAQAAGPESGGER